MLILARKRNQCIIINDDIEIVIAEIHHDQVKIGIKAPKNITIHRKEIYDNIKEEMKKAAQSPISKLKTIEKIKQENQSGEEDPTSTP